MEKADAELGSLCLVSTTADLELQLHSYANFAADDPDFTTEELISKVLDSPPAEKPWVSQGDTFKLVVTLRLDDTDLEPHHLLQTFAQKLYDSEVSFCDPTVTSKR